MNDAENTSPLLLGLLLPFTGGARLFHWAIVDPICTGRDASVEGFLRIPDMSATKGLHLINVPWLFSCPCRSSP